MFIAEMMSSICCFPLIGLTLSCECSQPRASLLSDLKLIPADAHEQKLEYNELRD